jgi:hypothetical protein
MTNRELRPDDTLARWTVAIRRFISQPAMNGVGDRELYIAACRAVGLLEQFLTECTLSRFCVTCTATFIVSVEQRAAFRSAGMPLPKRCPLCLEAAKQRGRHD